MNADPLDPTTLQALLLVTALAAMALYNRYQTRRAEREHPPSGRFITVDGVRLHYLDQGQGSPVVLLHGNVVGAEDYVLSGVFERTARTHRVLAFDRPGYGYSDRPLGTLWTASRQAELLQRALLQLGVERPVVVGHSWGTLVALKMALNQPDSVAGLVLLGGYYAATARLDVLAAAPPAIPLIGGALRHTLAPLLNGPLLALNLRVMFAPLPVPERFKRQFPQQFPLRPLQIRAESQDAVTLIPAVMKMRERYRELRLPIMIMAGTGDLVVQHERHARWLHEQLPGSHLQLIPEAGHMLHYAAPGQVAAAIERVAAEAPARSAEEPPRA
ncbi:alpha/beta fold hydrolase [Azotobacter chroococcum]|uniref:Alpha/beta hydrolase fold protein n=1 Tax=Azotobacter chroococcum NCIMB 8003 TaxID=1328314 RepID=A0A0C4WJ18_9GAMM|nr:alpha/beta hydrolase [Azotobacter chroococcum]AJE19819.1 Alpha/beta hydrolase fold protein [Azotobacter chroococcum NCIMB 8003]